MEQARSFGCENGGPHPGPRAGTDQIEKREETVVDAAVERGTASRNEDMARALPRPPATVTQRHTGTSRGGRVARIPGCTSTADHGGIDENAENR